MLKKIFKITALKLSLLIGFAFTVVAICVEVLGLFTIPFLDDIEYLARDQMFLARGKIEPKSNNVAIIAIDEKSIEQFGRWPWPRSRMAELVETLSAYYGVKVIGFDIVFSEPDENNYVRLIDEVRGKFKEVKLDPQALTETSRKAEQVEADTGKAAAAVSVFKKQSKLLPARVREELPDLNIKPKELTEGVNSLAGFVKSIDDRMVTVGQYLENERSRADNDETFARSLITAHKRGTKVVQGYFFFNSPQELETLDVEALRTNNYDIAEAELRQADIITGDQPILTRFWMPHGFRTNIPLLSRSTPFAGYFNQLPDDDGIYRRTPLFIYYEEKYIEDIARLLRDESESRGQAQKQGKFINITADSLAKSKALRPITVDRILRTLQKEGLIEIKPDGILVKDAASLGSYKYGRVYPSLSLACLSTYFEKPIRLWVDVPETMDEDMVPARLMIGERKIPIDERGRFVINYLGPGRTVPHYSVIDIIRKEKPKDALKDKVVLIGATTIGIYDLRHSPFDSEFPGVEIHANIIDNVMTESYLVRPTSIKAMELGFYLGISILLGILLGHIRLYYGVMLTILISGLFLVGNYYFAFRNGIWMVAVLPFLEMYTIMVAVAVFRYITEEREKGAVRKAFQFYLTKSVVEKVLEDPDSLKLGGQKREMTVMFSDVRGFTTISELLDAEELVALLNEYLTPMTDLVFEYDGTLDKYMGDAIMAFWGAPLEQPDHAQRACHTALKMMDKLKELQAGWAARKLPHLDIGIGINTGTMSVGNMGSANRFDYTVMGDSVNLGSRLEGINKEYGTNIIVSQFTAAKVHNEFVLRELDAVRVKGKKEPVHIYELIAVKTPGWEQQHQYARGFEYGLNQYRQQQWDQAETTFKQVLALRPNDGPATHYLERVEYLREHSPGADWDGVWTMKTK